MGLFDPLFGNKVKPLWSYKAGDQASVKMTFKEIYVRSLIWVCVVLVILFVIA